MSIKLTRAIFKGDNPFYPSFSEVAQQTWGGKTDSAIQPLARILQEGFRDILALQDKYVRELGEPQEDGGWGMKGASKANLQEYRERMDEVFAVEIALPIEEPIQLVKRKQTKISPFQAAALQDIFTVIWPEDDGSHLNK
jgi:hypothetical protein